MMSPTARRSGEHERKEGKKGARARTLLVGKNSLHVLAPLTLAAQADALIEKGRVEEAVALAGQMESSLNVGAKEVSSLVGLDWARLDSSAGTDVF